MKRLAALSGALAVLTLAPAANAAVDWTFYETAITSCDSTCRLPPQPFAFATLTLPGLTSSGTAKWSGFGAPAYTGDSFALSFSERPFNVSSAFTGNTGGRSCQGSIINTTLCAFDISWSETQGSLQSLVINLDGALDNVGGMADGRPFGLSGGPVASDDVLGGCIDTACSLAGFWQRSDPSGDPLPEPSPLPTVLAGLVGLFAVRRCRYQPQT